MNESQYKGKFFDIFGTLKDSREQGKVRHKLIDILFIIVSAAFCEIDIVEEIYIWAKAKQKLFLNRVNLSGIIKGGPLGGVSQNSKYKIDCRFNKSEIVKKIERIALLKHRLDLYNYDASELITVHLKDTIRTSFFNIDPPYVKKGQQLYTNYFKEEDHRDLEEVITEHLDKTKWIVTYDDCDLIRDIYKQYHMTEYDIRHNVGSNVKGKEIVITNIPESSFAW